MTSNIGILLIVLGGTRLTVCLQKKDTQHSSPSVYDIFLYWSSYINVVSSSQIKSWPCVTVSIYFILLMSEEKFFSLQIYEMVQYVNQLHVLAQILYLCPSPRQPSPGYLFVYVHKASSTIKQSQTIIRTLDQTSWGLDVVWNWTNVKRLKNLKIQNLCVVLDNVHCSCLPSRVTDMSSAAKL